MIDIDLTRREEAQLSGGPLHGQIAPIISMSDVLELDLPERVSKPLHASHVREFRPGRVPEWLGCPARRTHYQRTAYQVDGRPVYRWVGD